jgi:hypothetical protein
MGMTVSDMVTSVPSVYGATTSARAAVVAARAAPFTWTAALVSPVAALVAVSLAATVSDPAQMWHAGERYGDVATHIRAASSEMTGAVARHAGTDNWSERGKDAFVATRVTPYQNNLKQAAAMYDDIKRTIQGCAIAYGGAGISSALIGAAALNLVASLVATAGVPGANVPAAVAANAGLAQATKVARALMDGLTKVNSFAEKILIDLFARFRSLQVLVPVVGVGSMAGEINYLKGDADRAFEGTQTTLNWPRQLPAGAAMPAGYRAAGAADKDAIKKIRPESIKALGKDLDAGAAETLGTAYEQARGNDVGYPGFGAVGLHLAHAHSVLRDHAAQQLAASRDTPGTWLPGLRTNADNWIFAEQANVDATKHPR